jgi:DNA-binding Lrp family transcriptional regulator
MNQLSSEVKMTVKEISQITGISERTIQEHAKNMFPEIIQNGKTTYLNEAQATAIKFKVERSGRTDLANLFTISNIKTKTEKELIIFQAWGYINEKIENLKKNNSFDVLLQGYSSEEIENALLTLQSILNI